MHTRQRCEFVVIGNIANFLLFQDRWLLPLTQAGRGALSIEEITGTILRSGFLALQPRPTLQGPVLVVDVSRLPATANFSDTRCMYYLCSVFPYEFSTEQSMTIIVVVTSAPRQPLSTEKEVLTMVLEGFPIRIRTKFVTQA